MNHVVTPYCGPIEQTLPRLLSLFDKDRSSRSYGLGDRFYWAWGLTDFPNGTFQGCAHGLARLWRQGQWPYATGRDTFLQRLDAMFVGAAGCTRADGSLEEAFPNEGSFCVTALVAYDLLQAIDLIDEVPEQTRQRWLTSVEPMIRYLINSDETHAFISNHLATAVAALNRWHRETGDDAAENRARVLLDKILDHQSAEGWFEEYGGADPGYETLCWHYLSDVHLLRPDWKLLEPLRRSAQFLWHFAHPDGSFSGLYGSRCTRFYYPSGILALAPEIPEAHALSTFMASSISTQRVVTLASMDEPNLIPMFNSYCRAKQLASTQSLPSMPLTVPSLGTEPKRKFFSSAGLLVDRGPRHYTVISTHKGGLFSHFPTDGRPIHDAGVVARRANGTLGSTQTLVSGNTAEIQDDKVIVQSDFHEMPKRLPGPMGFLALRILCLTVFRFATIREFVKQILAKWVITRVKVWPASNQRTIKLGADLHVSDAPSLPRGYEIAEDIGDFVSIHMASQGYWQLQDEEETG